MDITSFQHFSCTARLYPNLYPDGLYGAYTCQQADNDSGKQSRSSAKVDVEQVWNVVDASFRSPTVIRYFGNLVIE
jgi:hypothetical protein